MTRRQVLLVVSLGVAQFACAGQPQGARPHDVAITGTVNPCYGPTDGQLVSIVAVPPGKAAPSGLFALAADGSFRIVVSTAKFPFGEYYLLFGQKRNQDGAGSLRFSVSGQDVDLGQVGECDL